MLCAIRISIHEITVVFDQSARGIALIELTVLRPIHDAILISSASRLSDGVQFNLWYIRWFWSINSPGLASGLISRAIQLTDEQNQSDQFGKINSPPSTFVIQPNATRVWACVFLNSDKFVRWKKVHVLGLLHCCLLLLNFAALNTNATRKQTMFRSQKTSQPVP